MTGSMAKPSSRGYGITKADVEASRLVFVSLRDSHPKRKVAIPVPDGYSWDQFINQVKTKLRLTGVGAVYFTSTGERVEKLDGLEDIDELCVEEIGAIPEPNGLHSSFSKDEASTSEIQISMTPTTSNLRTSISEGRTNAQIASAENGDIIQEDDEDDEKYNKRSSLLKRISQRIFPNTFALTLPLTNKSEEKTPRKRRKRSGRSYRTLFLLCAVVGSFLTMLLLYIHTSETNNNTNI